ncbi:amino acid ABC transporter substrate-binding protein [Lacisediminimonas profundi]|uniref:amino acid ABC transporter substrate-binding protein n=1 Tax=Lacisediminimonas profundi TaxID=2603856 RepID=UPI00124B8A46|nr:amino acid ABC transporter substrate-binding protein [Lacisediminimonas profundi]
MPILQRAKRFAMFAVASMGLFAGSAHATPGSCTDPIVFGTTISESGPFSTLADKWRKMSEVFAEEINKGGGIEVKSCKKKLPLKFVIYDDQSVPATATSLFERMATVDKVDFFVGPDWSSLGGPVPPIAEKHKIPMVAANIATPSFYERGLKYFWGTPYPVVPRWSERYFDMLSKMDPKPKTIYFITHDNPVMKAITGYWSKKAAEQGLTVQGNEVFPADLKDFTALISKVRAAKPDVIYISSFDGASVPLVQQMRQLKVRAMDVHHAMLTGSLQRQVGKDLEGMTGELSWYSGLKGPYAEFVDRVLQRSGIDMFDYIFTLGRVGSYLTMVQAIERAGAVDREKVREALTKGTFKSPAGDIVFDERGFPTTNGAFTIQMQNGKTSVVWPAGVATSKPIWPSPTWR